MKVKEPDTFSGRETNKLPPFLTQCTMWFMARPTQFRSDRARVVFAASYLRDLANSWWMPFLLQQPPPPILDSWDQFASELFQMFGDQHLQTTAQNAILALKMKDDERIHGYVVRFSSHAHYTGWNDAALAHHFYRGLNQRLKERFSYIDRPHTLAETRRFAMDFDKNYWEYKTEIGEGPPPEDRHDRRKGKKGKRSSHNYSQQPTTSDTNDRPTPTQGTAGKPDHRRSNKGKSKSTSQGQTSNEPKAERAEFKARGPLTEAEKDERKAKNLCYYCGQSGHFRSDCPKNRAKASGRATFTVNPTGTTSTKDQSAVGPKADRPTDPDPKGNSSSA